MMVDRVGKLLHSISFIRFFLVIYRLGLCHKLNDFVLFCMPPNRRRKYYVVLYHTLCSKNSWKQCRWCMNWWLKNICISIEVCFSNPKVLVNLFVQTLKLKHRMSRTTQEIFPKKVLIDLILKLCSSVMSR